MPLFVLGCSRSAANADDLAGASSTSPRAPAVLVHDTNICDTSRSPSTPYDNPTHPTLTLGEQNPDFLLVSMCQTCCVRRVKGRLWIVDPGINGPLQTWPFWPLVRALAALSRGGLAKPRRAGDLGQIWPNYGPRRFFLLCIFFFLRNRK